MLSILRNSLMLLAFVALALGAGACGKSSAEGDRGQGPRHAPADTHAGARTPGQRAGTAGGPSSFGDAQANNTAVPVEVATVERRSISFYIQSNGTLEAENEVDVVARTNGPIDEILTEEGRVVSKGQLLARIEDDEIRAQVEIGRVSLQEARLNFERAERLYGIQLLSPEDYEQARSRFETAQAQYHGNQLQLGYTEIRAPFSGHIVARYIDAGQQVSAGTPLFRLSDFDPLLCPIQVPERELPRLMVGQPAYLTVEAWPDERFEARVLRISPIIDAATGTVKVTLDVDARDKLRPGMFARVFLETDTHSDAIVVPKTALSLESLGDAVFVYRDGRAERRDIEVGFEEGDSVEVLSGVAPGEQVVVVGQDGLSHGTPIQVLGGLEDGSTRGFGGRRGFGDRRGAGGGMPDPSRMTAEDLDRLKERMHSRGLSDAEIEERLERLRERSPVSESTENSEGPSSTQR
ncbi:MAG: efflux RND transporter periplasmic adaptor subunit [Acidobacteria bacterium]|nr:efflux RND transporter periplasmic adaptor subunit [Acidobacteriota bacterium]